MKANIELAGNAIEHSLNPPGSKMKALHIFQHLYQFRFPSG